MGFNVSSFLTSRLRAQDEWEDPHNMPMVLWEALTARFKV